MVGFTGLLTAFRAGSDRMNANDISNIRILVIFSVSALVFALLPIPVMALGEQERWMRWLTMLLGAYIFFWCVQSPRWMKRKRVKPRRPGIYWTMIILQGLIGTTVMMVGVRSDPVLAIYSIGVAWLLVTAIIVFVVQIFAMLPIDPDQSA